MNAFCTLMLLTLVSCRLASAIEPTAAPKDVPPVVATAITSNDGQKWAVTLTIPKVTWKVVGERQPKIEWPKFQVNVEEVELTLSLDYPLATALSEESQNRIVDLKGQRLNRDETVKRLREKTPVLVSVSGRMPDAFYLQCTKPDTLIVILGIPDSAAPQLLPQETKEAISLTTLESLRGKTGKEVLELLGKPAEIGIVKGGLTRWEFSRESQIIVLVFSKVDPPVVKQVSSGKTHEEAYFPFTQTENEPFDSPSREFAADPKLLVKEATDKVANTSEEKSKATGIYAILSPEVGGGQFVDGVRPGEIVYVSKNPILTSSDIEQVRVRPKGDRFVIETELTKAARESINSFARLGQAEDKPRLGMGILQALVFVRDGQVVPDLRQVAADQQQDEQHVQLMRDLTQAETQVKTLMARVKVSEAYRRAAEVRLKSYQARVATAKKYEAFCKARLEQMQGLLRDGKVDEKELIDWERTHELAIAQRQDQEAEIVGYEADVTVKAAQVEVRLAELGEAEVRFKHLSGRLTGSKK